MLLCVGLLYTIYGNVISSATISSVHYAFLSVGCCREALSPCGPGVNASWRGWLLRRRYARACCGRCDRSIPVPVPPPCLPACLPFSAPRDNIAQHVLMSLECAAMPPYCSRRIAVVFWRIVSRAHAPCSSRVECTTTYTHTHTPHLMRMQIGTTGP